MRRTKSYVCNKISEIHNNTGQLRRKKKKVTISEHSHVPERLKGKVYEGGVLAVLLYGCESWCLTA